MSRRKLSKKQKVFNLLSKGENVTWKTLRKRFDLTSPTKMIDTLKSEGHCIYTNDTAKGVAYTLKTCGIGDAIMGDSSMDFASEDGFKTDDGAMLLLKRALELV